MVTGCSHKFFRLMAHHTLAGETHCVHISNTPGNKPGELTRHHEDTAMKALMTLPALLLAANTWAACPAAKPETAPVVPDGATASFEDMAAAQEAVKTYVADMEAWLECRSNLHPLMHNRAIALAEAAAESYNMELSSFRKRDQLLANN